MTIRFENETLEAATTGKSNYFLVFGETSGQSVGSSAGEHPEIPESFLQGWKEADEGDLEDFGQNLE